MDRIGIYFRRGVAYNGNRIRRYRLNGKAVVKWHVPPFRN